jgi:hypothetical protein
MVEEPDAVDEPVEEGAVGEDPLGGEELPPHAVNTNTHASADSFG